MAFGDKLGLLFEVKVDESDAVRGLKNTRSEIVQTSTAASTADRSWTSYAGAATLAVAGTVAVGSAIVGVTKFAYGLAEATAEAGSRFNDLSIKTGLSVETLSGLNLQLKQSGTSLESLTLGFFSLQRAQAAAEGGSKAQAAALQRLGVTSTDSETSLRQLATGLFNIKDVQERNAVGAVVLGKAYKELSVFFQDARGDIEGVINEARKLNVVMSKDAAEAADKFGDDMDKLNAQIEGVKIQIGSKLMPVFHGMVNDFSAFLRNNPGEVKRWGDTLVSIVSAVAAALRSLHDASSFWAYAFGVGNAPAGYKDGGRAFGNVDALQRGLVKGGAPRETWDRRTPSAASMTGGAMGSGGGGGRGGGKGTDPRKAAFDALVAEAELSERRSQNTIQANKNLLDAERDRQVTDTKAFYEDLRKYEDDHFNYWIDRINKELLALAASGKTKEEIKRREAEIDIEVKEKATALEKRKKELEDEESQQIAKLELENTKRQLQLQEEADARTIERIKLRVEAEVLAESEGERQITTIILEGFERRKKALQEESDAITTSAERRLAIADELIRMEGERAAAAEDAARRINAAIDSEAEKRGTTQGGLGGLGVGIEVGDTPDFSPWEEAFRSLKEVGQDALGSLSSGIGSMVNAWALGARSSELSIKKIVGSVIAGVAAQAATQAVLFTAYGVAALTPWGAAIYGPASQWFIAAGLMASIAGAAALTARALSGDERDQSSAIAGRGAQDFSRFEDENERENRFISNRSGKQISENSFLGTVLNRVADVLETFEVADKDALFIKGAQNNPHVVTDAVATSLQDSHGVEALQRGLNLA